MGLTASARWYRLKSTFFGSHENTLRENVFQDVDCNKIYILFECNCLIHVEWYALFVHKTRLYVPLAMRWWDDEFAKVEFKGVAANSFQAIDAAHIRLSFKPETPDAVLLWNQGEWRHKLSIRTESPCSQLS